MQISDLGLYNIVIDFNKMITYTPNNRIIYKENDINTSKIKAKLIKDNENIDLTDVRVEIRTLTSTQETSLHEVDKVDIKNGIIEYMFPINALCEGVNFFELILTKGDMIKTSPRIAYEVLDSIEDSSLEKEVNYPILIQLIKDVKTLKENTNEFLETAKASESVRIKNEETRVKQENNRQVSIKNMQDTFNNKIKEVDGTKNKLVQDVDTKINEVNTSKVNMETNVSNKINELDDKFKELQKQDVVSEVDKARGKYPSLPTRLDNLDKDLLNIKDTAIIPVTAESDFVTVEETVNGYFEDIKLEGKTLVNRGGSVNTQFDKYGEILNTSLKSDTLHTIRVVNKGANEIKFYPNEHVFKDGRTLTLAGNSTTTFKIYTLPSITGATLLKSASENGTLFNIEVLCLEGEFEELPQFFTGIKSVGDGVDEIVVLSCNSNPWDGSYEVGSLDASTGEGNSLGVNRKRSGYFRVIPGAAYSVKIDDYKDSSSAINLHVYDLNFNLVKWKLSMNYYINTPNIVNFVIPNEARYMRFRTEDNRELKPNSVIITKGVYKGYIKHKSDKKKVLYYDAETQAWKKPILREFDIAEQHSNGRYYYHKRSNERIFNGSEDWKKSTEFVNTCRFHLELSSVPDVKRDAKILSDKFSSKLSGQEENVEGVVCGNALRLNIEILKSRLSSVDVQGFKSWLQSNNVKVVYQSAQEKVYECTPIELITYENETDYFIDCGTVIPKTTFKYEGYIGNVVNTLKEKVSYLEDKLYKTNLANFTVALNTLDTKLKLEQLTKTPI